MGTRSGGRDRRDTAVQERRRARPPDGTSGAAAPVTVADRVLSSRMSTPCAAGARTVLIPQRRRSERCRHRPNITQLVTGRLEFKPEAVGLQSPRS